MKAGDKSVRIMAVDLEAAAGTSSNAVAVGPPDVTVTGEPGNPNPTPPPSTNSALRIFLIVVSTRSIEFYRWFDAHEGLKSIVL